MDEREKDSEAPAEGEPLKSKIDPVDDAVIEDKDADGEADEE